MFEHRLSTSSNKKQFNRLPCPWCVLPALLLVMHLPMLCVPAGAQSMPSTPDAPQPRIQSDTAQPTEKPPKAAPESPCKTKNEDKAAKEGASATDSPNPQQDSSEKQEPCPTHVPIIDWYARFLSGPQVKPLTPKEKGRLAVRNLIDPFNAITIAGNSAIYVGADSHSAYGPGMTGFGKNVGISYAQDGIGEFFGTFLIPSIARQDPHYHRMPEGSVPRRILHAIDQVVWTQGDNGKGMLNYANLVGFAIDAQIANFYVPGVQSNAGATTSRYLIGLGTAPADNFITEFLPDVARHIHFRIVIVQRIIDQVARTESNQ